MRSFLRNAVVLPVLVSAAMTVSNAWSAEPTLGPVVPNFGPVMAPPAGSFNLDPNVHYKVSMDMYTTPDFPGDQNRHLTSAARFLNMHARNGIPAENIEFALIVHGKAAKDLLTDEAYEERYNEPNPNTALLEELHAANVPIYLCSQTAAFRGMAPEEFSPTVTMSLSAMTAHVRLQQEGYTLVPF
ncbi:DsrE family protein [Congregibacter litoralis]|uniref:DsrE/DsrF-like family n=1 Tax=Congregibacter litoralis KT71 TaxID=314285 RepID=A4A7J8_9GAMM|nr:DsrE family protein [Congregibacter litoralis]EAQ98267.1 DsrE/DsrF-like family [Congregibacter litoralis KT71]